MRIRRSIIWGKALNAELTREMCNGPADAVCIDLEDGVPFARKAEARKNVIAMMQSIDFHGKERIIRVNEVNSPEFILDMNEVVAKVLPDSIRVPKCEHVEDMLRVDGMLSAIEAANGLPQNSIEIIALLESPLGLRNAYEIGTCCDRITALNLGMEDLTREMGVVRRYKNNELDLLYARQKFVFEAKAAGVQAIDAVLLLSGDDEETMRVALRSKQDGFTGRSCMNNEQCELSNTIFGPDPDELAWSEGAIKVYESAIETGEDMPEYQGRRICYAAYEKAIDLINYAKQIQAKAQ